MAVKLTYTNPKGKAVTFYTTRVNGEHPPYLLNYITGMGGAAVEYESADRTGGSGSYLGGPRFASRKIQTGCMIYGKTDAERDKRLTELINVLNPLLGDGTLSYSDHFKEYKTTARCALLPSFGASTKLENWKPVLIDYECAYPFFEGLEAFSTLVAASVAKFILPFKIPFSIGSQSYSALANNASAVPVPMRIIIWGPAVNPILTNMTTEDSLRVRKSILAGERLIIETGPVISVKIIDAFGKASDALNYVDLLSSQWIQLMPGVNNLSYSSDDDSKTTRIEAHWSDWYLGVG